MTRTPKSRIERLGMFARPPLDDTRERHVVSLTLTRAQAQRLDERRGERTRQQFLRDLIDRLT